MSKHTTASNCCNSEPLVLDRHGSDERSNETPSPGLLKKIVRDHYASTVTGNDGCGCGCSSDKYNADRSFIGEEYIGKEGYEADADFGLGCGVPTGIAAIKRGDVVLDLGSGAGIDAFIASKEVGTSGKVIGVDFTTQMIQKATENAKRLGYANVQFLEGDIENLPVSDRSIDVVISNCVLNLVPNKQAAFAEMYRVLKTGGHFAVSDVVTLGDVPDRLRDSAALYAGCVAGAIDREEYLGRLKEAGFSDVQIARERTISVPDSTILEVASREDLEGFGSAWSIASITVTGTRNG